MPTEPQDSLGYERVAVGTAVSSLTVPTGAGAALLQAETGDIRWLDSPGASTVVAAGTGLIITAGAAPFYHAGTLSSFRATRSGTVNATLHVVYYE